jgi:hypothetical protein
MSVGQVSAPVIGWKGSAPHTLHYAVGDNRIDIVRGDGATSRRLHRPAAHRRQ